MAEGNGVPKWVADEFERQKIDIGAVQVRIKALEDALTDQKIWRGKFVVVGMILFAIFNGFITLAIALATRKP